MIAEPYSASLVSRFAVPEKHRVPQGYYRSKLFIASSATNPVIAAAGPLFSLLERLCVTQTMPPVEEIRKNIEHEIHAFHSRLLGQEYANELIIIAKYLLSATIDELLGKNYLRVYGTPAEFKAFTPSALDDEGPQKRFFEITLYLKDHANQYLDLLELAYYCLIAGFEGEYHLKPDGRQALDNLIEEVYQVIQIHRVHKPLHLFKEQSATTHTSSNHKSLLTVGVLAVGVLIAVYLFSNILLEHKAKNVIKGHTLLASLDY
ncbi:type IVB secretion system protein IcmH/DotU [Legionella impletisoli]|uniref:IcmH n=1 Tax=Legionella impletisoli TaxID=343510 RepID=A0A917JWJ0_9GAMM|nr:type IVB secretion system protein IcmH/DotU [Legionella impletisoli]GGI89853.1 IcmH [Legionella impletisoli]